MDSQKLAAIIAAEIERQAKIDYGWFWCPNFYEDGTPKSPDFESVGVDATLNLIDLSSKILSEIFPSKE